MDRMTTAGVAAAEAITTVTTAPMAATEAVATVTAAAAKMAAMAVVATAMDNPPPNHSGTAETDSVICLW